MISTPTALKALAAAILIAAGSAQAAPAHERLDQIADELRHERADRGQWINPLMPRATGRTTVSADQHLAAVLSVYTREVLDRGGWVNPYVASPGYDAGHPLLAARPGDGVTSPVLRAPTTRVARAR